MAWLILWYVVAHEEEKVNRIRSDLMKHSAVWVYQECSHVVSLEHATSENCENCESGVPQGNHFTPSFLFI